MTKEQEMNEEALDTMMETLDETEDSSLDEESFMPEPREDEKTASPKRSVRPLSETGGLAVMSETRVIPDHLASTYTKLKPLFARLRPGQPA